MHENARNQVIVVIVIILVAAIIIHSSNNRKNGRIYSSHSRKNVMAIVDSTQVCGSQPGRFGSWPFHIDYSGFQFLLHYTCRSHIYIHTHNVARYYKVVL